MVRAFAAGIIIGIIAPLIGTFLVVKRYSLIADTLAHVSLLGVAGSILLNINPIVGALTISILASFGMEELRGSRKIFGESVLALFLSGSLAIALILIGLASGLNVNIFSYLFGSISTVVPSDIIIIVLFGLIVIITIVIAYHKLLLISLDEDLAKAGGLSVKFYNLMLTILAAITVSLAMRIVGILLVGALMVIPVISATQFSLSFISTIFLSILISLISIISGLYLSFYLDLPSGGTIVVIALLLFLISLILNKRKS